MPTRLETEIKYSAPRHYIFFDTEENDQLVRKLKPDTPEYFAWLSGLKSFHFEGKEGRFTARREIKKDTHGEYHLKSYWTAYRKHDHKQLRRYLGNTDKLSIATLEDTARHLTEKANTMEPKPKAPRKNPEKRETLLNRIKLRDRTIEEKNKNIEELEKQIEEQKEGMIKMQNKIQQLENQLQTKRL